MAIAMLTILSGGLACAADASPRAYFCEYPKSVTVSGHTVTTPTVCVPSP